MADFQIKAHDRKPSLAVTLTAGGVPLDLTNATTIDFIMKNKAVPGTIKVNAPAAIVAPATSGKVRYDWLAADTDTAGEYQAEFEIHWSDGKPQTAPTDSYITIDVLADLDNA